VQFFVTREEEYWDDRDPQKREDLRLNSPNTDQTQGSQIQQQKRILKEFTKETHKIRSQQRFISKLEQSREK
jgi:hypothetical protein